MHQPTPSSRPATGTDEQCGELTTPTPTGAPFALAPDVLAVLRGEWNSPQQAELEARRMFHRTLSAWAMDVLALRRRGLDIPRCRQGIPGVVSLRRAA